MPGDVRCVVFALGTRYQEGRLEKWSLRSGSSTGRLAP